MTEQASSAPAQAPAPQQGEAPSASPPSQAQRYKVKIDGQESEVPLEELINGYQSGVVSTKRFQQASQIRKEVDEVIGGLSKADKNSFNKLLKVVGEDNFRKLAEDFLIDKIQYESLPESDRKRIEAERKAEDLEEKLKSKDKEGQERVRAQLRQQAIQDIDTEITEVLQSTKKKPTPRFVARVVETMLANHQGRGAKLPAKDAYNIALKDTEADVREYLLSLDTDDLKKVLTKDQLKSLRMADVEAARSQFQNTRSATPKQEAKTQPKKKISLDEWFARKAKQLGE